MLFIKKYGTEGTRAVAHVEVTLLLKMWPGSKQSAAGNRMSGTRQLLSIQDSCGGPMGQMLPGLDDPKNLLFSGNTPPP